MYNTGMNKLNPERRTQVLQALVEGNSVLATCRMTGTAKGTVLRLLAEVGTACRQYHDEYVRELKSQRIQCDEIWAFCYAKEKNVPQEKKGEFGFGDVWTFVALDADTKLVPSWLIGARDAGCAYEFIADLKSRLLTRVQITTDGHKMYLEAVEGAFGADVDYAMLVKAYGAEPAGEARYSPPKCLGAEKHVRQGNPDKAYVSTSFIERQNLTMRMSMRRFTRLTNAFSKKLENLEHAVALHFMHYNFARPHKTLGSLTTPAMAAGLANHVWSIAELEALTHSN